MTGSWVSRIGFPLLGLAGLLAVLGSAGLTYAVYNKAFTETASVTVVVEQLGEQLGIPADVKVRGVRVGEVRSSTPDDSGKVVLELALEPTALADIPAAVTARILPKTLFGERYVELVVASGASASATGTLAEGAVIAQDTSARSVQLQEVFDELGPLLRTVQPADLNATLSSLAAALAGRGEELGGTLDRLGAYVAELRPLVPQLQTDLTLLADVTARYGEAAPALLAPSFDFVIDAVDRMSHKALLIAACRERGVPVLTVGGAGGRSDPGALRTGDLGEAGDELLRQVRRKLRRAHGFAAGAARGVTRLGVPAVWSAEDPVYPWADGTCGTRPEPGSPVRLDCAAGLGSAVFVTGLFGLAAAGEVVRRFARGSAKMTSSRSAPLSDRPERNPIPPGRGSV